MKNYLIFGAAMTGAGFAIMLELYLLGFHSDPARLATAQIVQGVLGLAIGITCIVLGTKARRAQVPATENFGYGSALGAGVMVTLFAALLGILTTYLYAGVLNPNFSEVIAQSQADKLEAKGLSADKIEQFQKMTAFWLKPPVQAVMSFFGEMFFGTVISLVCAAFLRRPAQDDLSQTPPPIA